MSRTRSAMQEAVIAQEPPCGSRRGMVGILLIFGLTVLKKHCGFSFEIVVSFPEQKLGKDPNSVRHGFKVTAT